MQPVLATNSSGAKQPEISFIGQGSRLQCVTGWAAPQMVSRDSPQFGVNGRHQAGQRLFIPIAPRGDQTTDVRHAGDATKKSFWRMTLFAAASRNRGRRKFKMTKLLRFFSNTSLLTLAVFSGGLMPQALRAQQIFCSTSTMR